MSEEEVLILIFGVMYCLCIICIIWYLGLNKVFELISLNL